MARILLATIACTALLVSCTHDPINPDPDPTPNAGACDPDTIYFQNDILPVFAANCASSGCHSATNPADGLNLTTYAGVMREVKAGDPFDSDVYTVLFDTGGDRMPPAPANPLDSTTQWKVRTWIEQGALNNSCNDCDSTSGSYSQTIVPILTAQCVSCHSGANLSGGVDLGSHSAVVNAVNSRGLLAAINRTGSKPMPPAAALNDCELAQFQKWINDGMPNN